MMVSRRLDGRAPGEMRGKELRTAELAHFDGSAYYSQGQTAVLVSLTGPTAARAEDYRRCLVEVKVLRSRMVPQAGGASRLSHTERQRALIVQDTEIASVVESCVTAAVVLERYPRSALAFSIDVLADDGGLLATVVNATMCAILDAGLACRTTFAAVGVCSIRPYNHSHDSDESSTAGSPGQTILMDPTKLEEDGLNELEGNSGPLASHNASMGTFIFSNPKSGGGLLASVMQARPSKGSVGSGGFSAQAYAELESWAEKAVGTLFEFMRNCGTPIEAA